MRGVQRQVIGQAIVGIQRILVGLQLGLGQCGREAVAADGGRDGPGGVQLLYAFCLVLHPPHGHAGRVFGVRHARQVLQRRVKGVGQLKRHIVDALQVHRVSKYVAILAVVLALCHQRARLVVGHHSLLNVLFGGDIDPGGGLQLRLALAEAGDVLVLPVLLGGGSGQPIRVVMRRHRHHDLAGVPIRGRQEALVRALIVSAVEEQRAMVAVKLILAALPGIQPLHVLRSDGVHGIRAAAGGGGVPAGHVFHQVRVVADIALGRHGQRDLPHGLFSVEAHHALGQLERAVAHRGHLFRHALLRFDRAAVLILAGVVHPEGQRIVRHVRQSAILEVVVQRECQSARFCRPDVGIGKGVGEALPVAAKLDVIRFPILLQRLLLAVFIYEGDDDRRRLVVFQVLVPTPLELPAQDVGDLSINQGDDVVAHDGPAHPLLRAAVDRNIGIIEIARPAALGQRGGAENRVDVVGVMGVGRIGDILIRVILAGHAHAVGAVGGDAEAAVRIRGQLGGVHQAGVLHRQRLAVADAVDLDAVAAGGGAGLGEADGLAVRVDHREGRGIQRQRAARDGVRDHDVVVRAGGGHFNGVIQLVFVVAGIAKAAGVVALFHCQL